MFSEDFVESTFGILIPGTAANYEEVAKKVRSLLTAAPQAIKALRAVEPSFAAMTSETFMKAGLNLDANFVDQLLSPFAG